MNNWTDQVVKKLQNEAKESYGMFEQEESIQNLTDKVIEVLSLNGTILELGCGFGRILGILLKKRKNIKYIGYDTSEAMLISAKEQYPEYKEFFIFKDITAPKIEHNAEIVIMNEVLIHLPLALQRQAITAISTISPKHIFLTIQKGDPKVEMVGKEDQMFYNVIQNETDFISYVTKTLGVKYVESKYYELIPGVQKCAIYFTK
jgi:SAM-dependent methyltransferase